MSQRTAGWPRASGALGVRGDEVFRGALEGLAGQPRLSGLADAVYAAHEQLGEPMRVAIAGRIKAGKSTMTNAMLGEVLVPTGREELTFNVNRLRFGQERSLAVHYKDGLVSEFTGPTLGNASPVNTIGVLTQVDRYWKDEEDPLQAGERVCERLYGEPGVARHLYRLQPVCGKIGLGAQTLTGHEAKTLRSLACVSDDALRGALETTRRFTEGGLREVDVPAEDRRAVLDRLDQYGVLLACRILREMGGDDAELKRELLRRSGVGELRELV